MLSSSQHEVNKPARLPCYGLEAQQVARDGLLVGIVMWLLAFALAYGCSVMIGNVFNSTVSEMVKDDGFAGKSFRGIMLVQSIIIFGVFYPYRLHNARIGQRRKWDDCCVILRQYGTFIGFMIVASIPTSNHCNALNWAQKAECGWQFLVHRTAAGIAFGSFIVAEGLVLRFNERMQLAERRIRASGLDWMIMFGICFIITNILLFFWQDQPLLRKTTISAWCFRFEVLLGIGLCVQQLLIWYFSASSVDNHDLLHDKLNYIFPFCCCMVSLVDIRVRLAWREEPQLVLVAYGTVMAALVLGALNFARWHFLSFSRLTDGPNPQDGETAETAPLI
mmetsp:Transcript_27503/g.53825  ORF Transcript_27503/g.53825 Transcript_27503/m.53825 type:complete len:335 (-) Transcript_27503:138-1142(-)